MKPSNEFCISFLKASGWLDNHDKQIRAEVIAEISREIRMLYGNEYEKKIREDAIDEYKNIWDKRVKDLINWCKDTRIIGLQQADYIFDEIAEQLKEQKK